MHTVKNKNMQAPKYILDLDAQRVLWDHRLHELRMLTYADEC
jgi:hypothetical protein